MDAEIFDVRILVVANECFSGESSNGRTMMNLLRCIPSEQLAQFYLHGMPDSEFCKNYFCVSDKDALRAFLLKKPLGNTGKSAMVGPSAPSGKKVIRNCRNLVLRNTVWMSFRWWDERFDAFLEEFAPSIVILQAGDMPFMFAIAQRIAKSRKIPLILYNSEEYVLKEKLYSGASKKSFWHRALQNNLKHEYKKIMSIARYCIYSTEYLESRYQERYPHPERSTTLYTVSEMRRLPEIKERQEFHLLYCGNLGVGRAEALAETAKVLYKTDSRAILDVYGKFLNKEDEAAVCGNPNVRYGGVIPYGEVPDQMSRADMVFHCENNDRLYNLQGAFSTKIADSLASGRPFLVYASRKYPFVQYLEHHESAHIAETPIELAKVLSLCMKDKSYRNKYVENGVRLAGEKHSVAANCSRMYEILKETVQ